MTLVLVITVAYLALADAGYQYNAPSVSLSQSGNQPAKFQGGQSLQHQATLPNDNDKPLSFSISYKDYVFIKKDNVHDSNQHHHSVNQAGGIQPVGAILDNAYAQPAANLHSEAQSTTIPGANLQNNYALNFVPAGHSSGHSQHYTPIANGNINSGYSHTSSQFSNNNFVPVGYNLNSGYTPNYAPITSGNVNSGNSQTVNSNIGYSHNIIPVASSNLNGGYAQAASASAANHLNNYYVNTIAPLANTNLNTVRASSYSAGLNVNTGYLQSPAESHAYSQIPSNINAGYSQTLTQTSNAGASLGYVQSSISPNLNTGYADIVIPSGTVSPSDLTYSHTSGNGNLNNGYSETLAPQSGISGSLNNGYAQAATPTTSVNLNTGYPQTFGPSGTAILNNGYAQSSISSANFNLNAGYQQSIIPTGSNVLNNGYGQASSNIIGTNLNTGYAQTSGNGYLNAGYVQNLIPQSSTSSFGATINSINALAGSTNVNFTQTSLNNDINARVSPAIYKHIYLHVPPPEVEEQRVFSPTPPPKKNYKILFIKVPSQESKSNVARLQQLAEMRNAATAVEHKTLIYVLVKNPETPQPVVIPKQSPSEHEVFFVKYNGNPLDLAAQVNQELDSSGTIQSIVPLEPGLVNGQA